MRPARPDRPGRCRSLKAACPKPSYSAAKKPQITAGAFDQIECPIPGILQKTTGAAPHPLVARQLGSSGDVATAAGDGAASLLAVQVSDVAVQFPALLAHPFASCQYDCASTALHTSTVPSASPWISRVGTFPVAAMQ